MLIYWRVFEKIVVFRGEIAGSSSPNLGYQSTAGAAEIIPGAHRCPH